MQKVRVMAPSALEKLSDETCSSLPSSSIRLRWLRAARAVTLA